ncbi:MAG TPA: hypothetical protein VFN10_16110 [Thermoanaerobaculia bacterium]|nr:hypothetical protein [Thermoanaerobaculia bacterium]
MKRIVASIAFIASFAGSAFAQTVVSTPRGVLLAHDHRVELDGRWSIEGLANPGAVVANDTRAIVLDPLTNEALLIELADGHSTRSRTADTPTDAAFLGNDAYILERDAQRLTRIRDRANVRVAALPAFLRVANGKLYVYSRAEGVVEEIEQLRVTRRVQIAPFASDFETDGRTGYLVFPREGKLRTLNLETMQATGAIDVGAVPVDLAFASGGSAVTARTLAIADPSAKRVWLIEGAQSMSQALARGFLRGLLGLGLYGNRASQFPTGVDRVLTRGNTWLAYDSSSRSLYRFTKAKVELVATDVGPNAFALSADGIAVYERGGLRRIRSGTPVAQTGH